MDQYRHVCQRIDPDHENLLRREDEILRIFADVSVLFRRQSGEDADDPAALSAGQYFLTYLRTLESRGAGPPPALVAALERALAHYGSDSLEVTPVLKSRLLWMWKAHHRVDQQVGVVVAILESRLRHASELGSRAGQSFLTVLDRLIASSEGQHPALTDLARGWRRSCVSCSRTSTACGRDAPSMGW